MAMGVAFQVQDLSFQYPSSTEETIKGITFDVLEGNLRAFRPLRGGEVHNLKS